AKVLRSSEQDQVTLVGAGVTVHTCLGAADLLAEEGISARVIDCYSVKPIDTAALAAAGDGTGGGGGGGGSSARVSDCFWSKPSDTATLAAAVDATGGRIVVAEDHHPQGGLGSAVTDALLAAGRSDLSLAPLAVRGMPGSGSGGARAAPAGAVPAHHAGG